MTNYLLHIHKRYGEILEENLSKRTNHNFCRVYYSNGNFMLSSFYCKKYSLCVCVYVSPNIPGENEVEVSEVVINV